MRDMDYYTGLMAAASQTDQHEMIVECLEHYGVIGIRDLMVEHAAEFCAKRGLWIMERLTIPDEKIEGGMRRAIIDTREVKKCAMTFYWALKAYEDTGLTPEEIMDGKMLTGWIPVEEQLPPNDDMVLVSCQAKNGNQSVNRAYYMSGSWHGSGSMSGVRAWMPMPEPYMPDCD